MPGHDLKLITHNLVVRSGYTPVKQLPRKFSLEIKGKTKQNIEKLLKVGFIKPIWHPIWLEYTPSKKEKW